MRFLALAAVACVLAPGTRGSAVVVVPTDAPTLADAVATAADGDIIELLPGLYAGSGFRDIAPGAKALTVRSQSGDAADTILDLESSGGLFQTDRAMTLEGLTVRYGAAAIIGGSPATAIVVRECRMELNAAVVASTIEASVSLIDSEFVDNGASIAFTDQGSLTVSGCSFTRNQGGVTGGDGLIDVTGSSFVDNVGAVNATSNTTLAVSSCTFSGGAGPAVSMGGSSTSGEIADCRFEGLETTARGAAIGCGVVDVTAPTTAIADFDVRPNPANRNVGFDLPGVSARADIDIFDTSGRRVRRLRVASGVAATWDLRGASGMPVAAGVYWARFRADGVSATRRVVVAR